MGGGERVRDQLMVEFVNARYTGKAENYIVEKENTAIGSLIAYSTGSGEMGALILSIEEMIAEGEDVTLGKPVASRYPHHGAYYVKFNEGRLSEGLEKLEKKMKIRKFPRTK